VADTTPEDGLDTITRTNLWRRTLGEPGAGTTETDPSEAFRSRLRQAFIDFRRQAGILAKEIPLGLPTFTVHDLTHIDALWEVADMIVGNAFQITPTEAFVLGGAFLLHDLGMALASYPDGCAGLESDPIWRDVAHQQFRRVMGRSPTTREIMSLDPEIKRAASEETLRIRHAKQAEALATIDYQHTTRDTVYYLIGYQELRSNYGPLIGRIAHSHWWPVEQLTAQLDVKIGPYASGPADWTIDPIRLALILRVADACHLDSRRAPGFLRALRKPSGLAEKHWRFQEYVQKPYVDNGRMVFTSANSIPLSDSEAWRIGYELLNVADKELHDADTVLRDTQRQPLAVQSVAGAGDPLRLCRYIPIGGWKPILTTIRVTDVAGLIRKIGGRGMYGDDPRVPLRELIQNSRDAVVARRLKQQRDRLWGEIRVSLFREESRDVLESRDTGVGMSDELLAGPFLEFSSSYWDSSLMLREHPGLASTRFDPQGRFGIGFFSVFMWGERVKVTTRRPEDGIESTRVLEFRDGLSSRPILRQADAHEALIDPGTVVRVVLDTPATQTGGLLAPGPIQSLLKRGSRDREWSLRDLCAWLCPALDVDLHVEQSGKVDVSVTASDWETVDAATLLRRLILHRNDVDSVCASDEFARIAANLRSIKDDDGVLLGRGALKSFIYGGRFHQDSLNHASVVTAGSFRSDHQMDTIGLLLGQPEHSSRFGSRPIAYHFPVSLSSWATEQAGLVSKLTDDLSLLGYYGLCVRLLGGDTGGLPIARAATGFMSFYDIASRRNWGNEVYLQEDMWGLAGFCPSELRENGLAVITARMKALSFPATEDPQKRADHPRWKQYWLSLWGAAIEAIARSWGVPLQEVLEVSEIASDGMDRIVDEQGRDCMRPKVDIIRNPRSR
jgi:hypothetical protein